MNDNHQFESGELNELKEKNKRGRENFQSLSVLNGKVVVRSRGKFDGTTQLSMI